MHFFLRHPDTTIIWTHTGLGRGVRLPPDHLSFLEDRIRNPTLGHIHFDISWDEVAKYVVEDDTAVAAWADLINRYPSRFLFSMDAVAPDSRETYLKTYRDYELLWVAVKPETRHMVLIENYEGPFDATNKAVRNWERRQL